jgi:hypothetical protein
MISGSWSSVDYTYTDVTWTPATMISPSGGSTFSGTSQLFTWNAGSGVTEYALRIGSTGVGSTNLYNGLVTAAMSTSVSGLPTNGETVFVRLYSLTGGIWLFNDYTYTAFTETPATLTGPNPGTLGGSSQLFTWNAGAGVTEYALRIGSTGVGSTNLYNGPATAVLSTTVSGLPTNGETVYVRLYSLTGGVWLFNDYTFTAFTETPATMISPSGGSAFSGPSQIFTWNAGAGVTEYALRIGSTGVGSTNLYNGPATTVLSATVSGLPTNGETVYVRLYSLTGGVWLFNDYTYSAFTEAPATMLSPSGGTQFGGPSQLFTWSAGAGVTEYILRIGSTGAGSSNLYNGPATTAMSATVTNLPTNAETVYVRLWSLTCGVWLYNDYIYTAK